MHEYEIRILRDDLSTAFIIERTHLNNNAAIRSAQKLAGRRRFEIWSGLDCIYGVSDCARTRLLFGSAHPTA
jgi:hypothetical protein